MYRQDTIDLSSSPEPVPTRPTRSRSRPLAAKNRHHVPVNPIDVIDLSSDSDDPGSASKPAARASGSQNARNNAKAGPSLATRAGRSAQPTQHRTARPLASSSSGSLENIPDLPRKQVKPRVAVPLFLPSDEENEPPPRGEEETIVVPAVPLANPQPARPNYNPNSPILRVASMPTPELEHQRAMTPEAEPDPLSGYVSQILEIVPDVEPDHLLALVMKFLPDYQEKVVEPVLHALFEDPTYPKIDKKGKRKRVDDNDASGKKARTIEYGSLDRKYTGGVHYSDIAIVSFSFSFFFFSSTDILTLRLQNQLQLDFPDIPKPHIRKMLSAQKGFYAPTYIALAAERKRGAPLPYKLKKSAGPSVASSKGKQKVLEDEEFDREREWLLQKLQEESLEKDEAVAEELDIEENGEDNIECGCCFSDYPFVCIRSFLSISYKLTQFHIAG